MATPTEFYFHNIDIRKNQLINARLQNVTSSEKTIIGALLGLLNKGFIVYDTDILSVCVWNGTAWDCLSDGTVEAGVIEFNGRDGLVVPTIGDYNTGQVIETTNLYFTVPRVRESLSAGTGISYDSVTGVISSTITQYTDEDVIDVLEDAVSNTPSINLSLSSGVLSADVNNIYVRNLFSAGLGLVYDPVIGRYSLDLDLDGKIKDAYDDTVTGITIIGTVLKTVTLTRRDGTTLTTTFTDLTSDIDNNNYPNSLVFSNGVLTLGRTGLAPLSTEINLSSLLDVNVSALGVDQLLKWDGTDWVNFTPTWISSYTETDPIFNSHVASGINVFHIQNWNTAYYKYPTGVAFSGTETKTLTLTLNDGTALTGTFTVPSGANNYASNLVFDPITGNLTLSRTGLSNLVANLDGRYLTECCEETDPIFTASPAFSITNLMINNWTTAYNDNIVSLFFTGTTTKTLTLVQRDGGTLSAIFEDLVSEGGGGEGGCIADGNNYTTNITFEDGVFTLSRFEMSDLTVNICLAELCDVNLTTPTDGQVLVYNSTTEKWENETLDFLDDFTEVDPIALAKTVTVTQGTGITITGTATQALSVNPAWTVALDKTYTDTLYVPLARTITINGTTYDLSTNPTWTLTSTNITEGSNLYYTDTRARAAISATTPILYSNTTGIISHATSGVTAGTYNNVTVNTHGHVTAGSNVAYLQSYTETDPIALAKTMTLIQGNGIIIEGDETQTLGDEPLFTVNISNTYVRGLFSAGDGIDYNSATGVISATGVGTSAVVIIEVQFRIGDFGRPEEDDTSFILTDCNGDPILGRKLDFYREGELMSLNDAELGFTYDPTTAVINVVPAFWHRERIIIKAHPASSYTTCLPEPPEGENTEYASDYENTYN